MSTVLLDLDFVLCVLHCETRRDEMDADGTNVRLTNSSNQSFKLFLVFNIFLTLADCFFLVVAALLTAGIGVLGVVVGVEVPVREFILEVDEGMKDVEGISVGLVR